MYFGSQRWEPQSFSQRRWAKSDTHPRGKFLIKWKRRSTTNYVVLLMEHPLIDVAVYPKTSGNSTFRLSMNEITTNLLFKYEHHHFKTVNKSHQYSGALFFRIKTCNKMWVDSYYKTTLLTWESQTAAARLQS